VNSDIVMAGTGCMWSYKQVHWMARRRRLHAWLPSWEVLPWL